MSTTGPRPADLPFDHAAAAEAEGALDRAAAVLRDVGEGRTRAGAVARADFEGVYAEDFAEADRQLGQSTNDARSAIAALRAAITGAARDARAAQAGRAAQQEAWDAAHVHPPPVGVR